MKRHSIRLGAGYEAPDAVQVVQLVWGGRGLTQHEPRRRRRPEPRGPH